MKLYTQPKPAVFIPILFAILLLGCSSFISGCADDQVAESMTQYKVENVCQGESMHSCPQAVFTLKDRQGNVGTMFVDAENEEHVVSLTETFKGKTIETYPKYLKSGWIPRKFQEYSIRIIDQTS